MVKWTSRPLECGKFLSLLQIPDFNSLIIWINNHCLSTKCNRTSIFSYFFQSSYICPMSVLVLSNCFSIVHTPYDKNCIFCRSSRVPKNAEIISIARWMINLRILLRIWNFQNELTHIEVCQKKWKDNQFQIPISMSSLKIFRSFQSDWLILL